MISTRESTLPRFALLAACLLAGSVGPSVAAGAGRAHTPLPPSLGSRLAGLEAVQRVTMPQFDLAALRAEDAIRDAAWDGPARFAMPLETTLSSATEGTWEELADGSWSWRLRIASPGALSLNLAFTRFDLPAGARLWLYDPRGDLVQGPFAAADRSSAGELWSPIVLGDEVVVEAHIPGGGRAATVLEIGRVNHGYRFFGESRAPMKQQPCELDVICPEGDPWRSQIRSVGRYTLQGYGTCSGAMVNNTSGDRTPYFLTAWHCGISANNAATMVVYWNYESPSCGDLSGGRLDHNQSGAIYRASIPTFSSDFALVELAAKPDPAFNVFYAGWDATGYVPSGAVGIHHPNLDEKAISLDFDPLRDDHVTHWRVQWDRGVTEPGSSGSPIFDPANGLLVGTLTGGSSSCSNPSGSDTYGKVSMHFVGYGAATTRLRDWLDPLGTGALQLAGTEASGGGPEPEPTLVARWLIPAIASRFGLEGSDWRSELAVVNPTGETILVELHFVAEGEPWPGQLLGERVELKPGESLYLRDPLLPLRPVSGTLYVATDRAGTRVSSRTYNLTSSGFTYGQGIPALPIETASAPGELILPLVHSEPARFRTNLGLVLADTGTFTFEVAVHASDGTVLANKTYGTGAAYLQITDVFSDLGIGASAVEGAWVSVRLLNQGALPHAWTCYATVVDAGTGDPTYVSPT